MCPNNNIKHLQTNLDPTPLQKRIREGENDRQDFKFNITDARKIAKTLVAFANTYGGSILIGVKDNGKISGVNAEEEYYMIESAANYFCDPTVDFSAQLWDIEDKTVLEIIVEPSDKKPHFAKSEKDTWIPYIRVDDENIKANSVLLKYWEMHDVTIPSSFEFTETEKRLLNYIDKHGYITFIPALKLTGITPQELENLLAKLLRWKVVELDISTKGLRYTSGSPA